MKKRNKQIIATGSIIFGLINSLFFNFAFAQTDVITSPENSNLYQQELLKSTNFADSGNDLFPPRQAAVETDTLHNQYFAWTEQYPYGGQICNKLMFKKINAFEQEVLPETNLLSTFTISEGCSSTANNSIQHLDLSVDNNGNAVVAFAYTPEADLKFSNDIQLLFIPRTQTNFTSGASTFKTTVANSLGSETFDLDLKKNGSNTETFVGVTNDLRNVSLEIESRLNIFKVNFSSGSVTASPNNFTIVNNGTSHRGNARLSFANGYLGMVAYESVAGSFPTVNIKSFTITNPATPTPNFSLSTAVNVASFASKVDIAGSYRTNPTDNAESIFYLAYQGRFSADTTAIAARKINCTSLACVSDPLPVRVNNQTTGIQATPRISVSQNQNDNLKSGTSESNSTDIFGVTWVDPGETKVKLYSQMFTGRMNRIGTNNLISDDIRVDTSQAAYPTSTPTITDRRFNLPDISVSLGGEMTITYKSTNAETYLYKHFATPIYQQSKPFSPHAPSNSQKYHSMDISPTGNMAIVYTDYSNINGDIFLSLYDKFGSPIQQSILVNKDFTNGTQNNPQVAFFSDTSGANEGSFIVTWQGESASDISGANYQLFNSDGTYNGNNQLAHNPTPSISEEYVVVSAGQYNNFVMSWYENGSINQNLIVKLFSNGTTRTNTFSNNSEVSGINISLNPAANGAIDAQIFQVYRDENSFIVGRFLSVSGVNLNASANADLTGGGVTSNFTNVEHFTFNNNEYFALIRTPSTDTPGQNGNLLVDIYQFNNNSAPISTTIITPTYPVVGNYYQLVHLAINPETLNAVLAYQTNIPHNLQMQSNGTVCANCFKTFIQPLKISGTTTPQFNIFGAPIRVFPQITENQYQQLSAAYQTNPQTGETFLGVGSDRYSAISEGNDIFVQNLTDPFGKSINQNVVPETTQEVLGGGKWLNVPEQLNFGAISPGESSVINTSNQPLLNDTSAISGGIKITDLDGAPFNITISASNFAETTNSNITAVSSSNLQIKNNDGINAGVIANNNFTTATDLTLNASTNNYVDLSVPRTLATKANNNTGEWKIFPSFRLQLPPSGLSNGNYQGTLTFTII